MITVDTHCHALPHWFEPVAGREGYRNALRWTMEHIPCRSDEDKAWSFGKTSLSLFKFAQ
jgi:hypothetical protein